MNPPETVRTDIPTGAPTVLIDVLLSAGLIAPRLVPMGAVNRVKPKWAVFTKEELNTWVSAILASRRCVMFPRV